LKIPVPFKWDQSGNPC